MINKAKYCRLMLKYRGRMMPLHMFLGGKWIFLKIILFGVGFYAVLQNDTGAKILGGLLLGYALGKTVAGFMSYLTARKTWRYANDLLDWDRVNEQADGDTEPD